MADADPPNEVGNIEGPRHGMVVPPDANPLQHEIAERHEEQVGEHECDRKSNPPSCACAPREYDRADLVGDGSERVARRDDRRRRRTLISFGGHLSSSGFRSLMAARYVV